MGYDELVSAENLFTAFAEYKKGKKRRPDLILFEQNLEDNIFSLSRELSVQTYQHGKYEKFYIWDPKFRVIHKAPIRDRIVHHAVFKYLNEIFDKTFIFHSYSSRLGKGTHLGVNNLVKMTRKVSHNFTLPTHSLKCDIRKFFANIDHKILYKQISSKIGDPQILWLIHEIIESHEKTGIPLGNITSQIFANIYLDSLDKYIKYGLRIKFYLRYADDFVILHQDRQYVDFITDKIGRFLAQELKITLHPQKISNRKIRQGIDFLGYVCLPYHRILRPKTKKRLFRKLKDKWDKFKNGIIFRDKFNESLQSYLGILKHADSFKIQQAILELYNTKP